MYSSLRLVYKQAPRALQPPPGAITAASVCTHSRALASPHEPSRALATPHNLNEGAEVLNLSNSQHYAEIVF